MTFEVAEDTGLLFDIYEGTFEWRKVNLYLVLYGVKAI